MLFLIFLVYLQVRSHDVMFCNTFQFTGLWRMKCLSIFMFDVWTLALRIKWGKCMFIACYKQNAHRAAIQTCKKCTCTWRQADICKRTWWHDEIQCCIDLPLQFVLNEIHFLVLLMCCWYCLTFDVDVWTGLKLLIQWQQNGFLYYYDLLNWPELSVWTGTVWVRINIWE